MEVNQSHLLSWILFTPLIGAIVLLLIPRSRTITCIAWSGTCSAFSV